jgi:hypothetical protein
MNLCRPNVFYQFFDFSQMLFFPDFLTLAFSKKIVIDIGNCFKKYHNKHIAQPAILQKKISD